MNYFKCDIGGGGRTLKLTVTCDADFARKTITFTDGTTIITKTCPATSPYQVVFNVPNGGTWTVSGVVNGTTYSQSVVIPSTASLHVIPVGSTVTPVNDIQTWLHCADIWDKNYTTISQVLADTTTLLALISSNNAADYMARSTSWASTVCANQTAMGYIGNNDYCARELLANNTWLTAICNSTYFESVLKIKVPTMTSDTAPSGQVTYSTPFSYGGQVFYGWLAFTDAAVGGYTWKAFVSVQGTSSYLQYKFPTKVQVNKLFNKRSTNTNWCNYPIKFKLQGSNDGTNWTDITGELEMSVGVSAETTKIISNNTKYQYYRIQSTNTNVFDIARLQLWGV